VFGGGNLSPHVLVKGTLRVCRQLKDIKDRMKTVWGDGLLATV
jgi:hypothetical protein